MLKVSGDGRKAALDLRLVGLPLTLTAARSPPRPNGSAAIWADHRDDVCRGHRRPGAPETAAACSWCSATGTPRRDGWNVYDELNAQLVDRGLTRDAVRFIHDANNDRDQRRSCSPRAGTGRCAVLIGSHARRWGSAPTSSSGWWPCTTWTARGGRRTSSSARAASCARATTTTRCQIYRYVTEGQLRRVHVADRGTQSRGSSPRSCAATRRPRDRRRRRRGPLLRRGQGPRDRNPLIMDKAEADAELAKLQRAERAWLRNHDALRQKVAANLRRAGELEALTGQIDTAIGRRRSTRGDAFSMTLGTTRLSRRNDAGEQLKNLIAALHEALTKSSHRRLGERPGQLGGFDVTVVAERVLGTTSVTIALDGAPGAELRMEPRRHPGARPRQAHRPARRPPRRAWNP